MSMSTNMLDVLITDIIIHITTFLNNHEKIKFLSVSKKSHTLKNKIYYYSLTPININKIHDLHYHDRFTNVHVCNYYFPLFLEKYKFSKSITHLTFCTDFKT